MGWFAQKAKQAGRGVKASALNPLRNTGAVLPRQLSAFRQSVKEEVNHEGHVETFIEAVSRYGLSEEGLKARYQQYRWIVISLILPECFCLYTLVSYIADLMIGHVADSVLGVLGSTVIFCVMLAKSIESGFRAWQIRNQRLGGLLLWLHTPSEWWPRALPSAFSVQLSNVYPIRQSRERSDDR